MRSVVVERPVLDQPPVEGPEQVADRLGVVGQGLLVDHPEGGEEQAPGQLLLCRGRARRASGSAVGRTDRLPAGQELHGVAVVGVAPEVVVHGPGKGHRVERRIGDGVADLAPDHVVAAPVDLAPLDDPGTERRVEVPGEGVECLVVVVVCVEDRVVEPRRVQAWSVSSRPRCTDPSYGPEAPGRRGTDRPGTTT